MGKAFTIPVSYPVRFGLWLHPADAFPADAKVAILDPTGKTIIVWDGAEFDVDYESGEMTPR